MLDNCAYQLHVVQLTIVSLITTELWAHLANTYATARVSYNISLYRTKHAASMSLIESRSGGKSIGEAEIDWSLPATLLPPPNYLLHLTTTASSTATATLMVPPPHPRRDDNRTVSFDEYLIRLLLLSTTTIV